VQSTLLMDIIQYTKQRLKLFLYFRKSYTNQPTKCKIQLYNMQVLLYRITHVSHGNKEYKAPTRFFRPVVGHQGITAAANCLAFVCTWNRRRNRGDRQDCRIPRAVRSWSMAASGTKDWKWWGVHGCHRWQT